VTATCRRNTLLLRCAKYFLILYMCSVHMAATSDCNMYICVRVGGWVGGWVGWRKGEGGERHSVLVSLCLCVCLCASVSVCVCVCVNADVCDCLLSFSVSVSVSASIPIAVSMSMHNRSATNESRHANVWYKCLYIYTHKFTLTHTLPHTLDTHLDTLFTLSTTGLSQISRHAQL